MLLLSPVTACINAHTHTHTHTHMHARKCKRLHSKPVALCGKTTVPLCVLDTLPKENPCWRREIFRIREKGKIFQTSSLELFCLCWITDYIDGFGHSQPDLELPLLKSNNSGACKEKSSMDKGNIYAQNEPPRAAFLSQIQTSIHPTTHTHTHKYRCLP